MLLYTKRLIIFRADIAVSWILFMIGGYTFSLINPRYQNETLINDRTVAVLRCIYGIKILE